MLAVSAGQLCNNNSTSISLIHKCDKCTAIFCLHHPPTGPFCLGFFFFFQGRYSGARKIFLSAVQCRVMMNKLWGESCLQEENKTRNNVEKWAPHLVFAKQLMLLAVGKSARGQNPSLVLLSPCMQSTSRVSHCVKKEHIQMCMAIKC